MVASVDCAVDAQFVALYTVHDRCWDGCSAAGDGELADHECMAVTPYFVTKVTAARIYFRDSYDRRYFIARSKFRDDGDGRGPHAWHERVHLSDLYLEKPTWHLRQRAQAVDLTQLRQEMADAHPDRGGSSSAFGEARAKYLAAKAGA